MEEKFASYCKGRILMKTEEKTEALAAAKAALDAGTAYERLKELFDDGVFTEIDAFVRSKDGYAEVVGGHGTIDGMGVYAFAQNADQSGGAMSQAQAKKILKIYDLALKTGEPIVGMYDSAGGRLDEGAELLASYGSILRYTGQLSGVVPQISVVLGKCCGTQALIAASADVVIMSEKAAFSLKTDGQESSAEQNAQKGLVHCTAEDEAQAIAQCRKLISMLPSNNLTAACIAYDSISAASDINDRMTAKEAAFAAADEDSLFELQKDFASKAATALATVNGTTVGLVSLTGDVLDGKACQKAAKLIRFCDAFSIPVVSFVDAEKFACMKGALKLSSAYAEATAPKITFITGNAYGAVYIAAAGTSAAADMTYAWAQASISALDPEAAAVILWGDDFGGKLKGSKDPQKDKAALIEEFKDTELSAMKAAEQGYVDDIITASQTREKLVSALSMLCNKRVETLPKKHSTI